MFRTVLVHHQGVHQLFYATNVLTDGGPPGSETCSSVVFNDNCVRLLVNSNKALLF